LSERGVFALDRGWFGHPSFAAEPFTEREAWAWLISEAAFKARTKRVSSAVIALDRGQVAASLRFMAQAWQWEFSRVRRFLGRLKTDTMIDTATQHGITVITVCNYDKYQRVSLPKDTDIDTANATATQQQRHKLEENKYTEVEDGGGKRAKLISDEAQDTADALAAACGFTDPKNCPLGWYGAAAWVQKCFNEGWPADLMIEAAKETAKRKRDGPIEHFKYLEKPLAKAIAEHSRPLPKIEIREAETVIVHAKPKNAIIQAIDDLGRTIAGFDGPARKPDELRGEPGENPVRLLSHR
jgi:hypothetical protein